MTTEQDARSLEVLICGAGAAGLTLALDLARRGIRFRLIEKLAQPFHGSRGKGIQPRSQEIFEDLGVLDRLVSVGGFYPPERRYNDDGSFVDAAVTEHVAATHAEPYHLALMVPQFKTEAVLRDRLLEYGHRVSYGCELIGFAQHGDAVTARLTGADGEETVTARWLVGADGGRSFVRRSLNIDFPGKTLGVRAIVADVSLTGLSRDAWHRFRAGDMVQQIAVAPLAGTDMFQIQAPVPFDADVDLSAGGLAALLAQRSGRDDIVIHAVSWASAYEMNARLADRYRSKNVLLIGDAAHIHPPTGGQGLNTSVQDAYNLGWKLAAVTRGAPDALLDTYEEERRPVAAAMLGLATKLLDKLKTGDLRRGREVSQLDVGYGTSSLALNGTRRDKGLLAGDRAPDALLQGAGGQPRRLFGLFQGTHWTLLKCLVDRTDSNAQTATIEAADEWRLPPRPGLRIAGIGIAGDLHDVDGHFFEAYTPTPGDWILVRPDGYIGAIVSSEKRQAVEDYLVRVGPGSLRP